MLFVLLTIKWKVKTKPLNNNIVSEYKKRKSIKEYNILYRISIYLTKMSYKQHIIYIHTYMHIIYIVYICILYIYYII